MADVIDQKGRLYASIPLRRALMRSLGLAWRADPLRTLLRFLLVFVESAGWALEPLGIKGLVNAAISHDGRGAALAVIAIAVMHGVGLLGDWFGFMIGLRLRESIVAAVDTHIIELTTAAPGIEHLERPDIADELTLLRTERETFATITDALGGNLRVFAQIGATVGLLAAIHPLLLLLPLFGLPAIYTGAKAMQIVFRVTDERSEITRSGMYTYTLATKASAGKEIRVFGLRPELQRRLSAKFGQVRRLDLSARIRMTAWNAAGWLVFVVGFTGAIGFVALRAVDGKASVGELVLALTLAGQVNAHMRSVAGGVNWLLGALRSGRRLVWFEDYVRERTRTDASTPVPARLEKGIAFEDVSFVYPGTETEVLANVTLTIPAGATVAIVGDNGAGKTTLVKLMCGFYAPTRGQLRVDGIDLAVLDMAAWRSRISAGFQDFVHYELEAGEAVGIGDLPRLGDEAVVSGAVRAANADDVIADLPAGFGTQLGKSFDGGVELSGGQWQKLALSRAMMRDAPLLLLLDEPSAALDAATEHALFERFTTAARSASDAAGAITLVVSHRFSTVRMADLIVVVESGRVTEVGTHPQLLARRGTYAQLYELQAAAYR